MIERYTLPEIGGLWTEEAKYRAWLEVELAVCRARAELGEIPSEEVDELAEKADFTVERIHEIEEETNHDVIAFVSAVAETVDSPVSRHFHFGLTSSDVLDTAGALQLRNALDLIRGEARELAVLLCEMALEHRETVMVGRTHGVHAEPTVLGHKLAVWAFEMERNLERLSHAREVAAVGKISGAVGTYANVDPKIETLTCEGLGLASEPASTQIVQRDRHAEVLSTLAILASTIEKIALEVRGAQRTEVRELSEPFGRGQKGSSAMPHKKNPILSERLCGMARLMRGYAGVGFENNALWQERDISHSSAERVVLPDATILAFYMLRGTGRLVRGLQVHRDRMRENLNLGGGIVYSGRVLLALVEAGMGRDEAYAVVQGAAMQAWEGEGSFREMLEEKEEVRELLGATSLTSSTRRTRSATSGWFSNVWRNSREGWRMTEELLYEGKAKKVFTTGEEGVLLHRYKDDATAFNAQKRGSWKDKGKTNATMSAAIFSYLETHGVPTHFVEQVDDTTIKTKKLDMLPVEIVVRNVAAGSLSRMLGFEEGRRLKAPIVELCYKDDALGDPLCNWYHLRELGVSDEDLEFCEELGLKVNEVLAPFFDERGITLVDFKIEAGKDAEGNAMLADEISPDTCRFWDKETGEKLDKDRFRNDMGGVEEAYAEMLRRVTEITQRGAVD